MHSHRIGRLAGRYVVTWWGDDGTRRRFRLDAATLREAQAEALDVVRRETTPASPTVEALWAAYADYLGDRPTGRNMRYVAEAIIPVFGKLRPDQITPDDCKGYAKARAAAGKKPGTVHTELGYLRSTLVWARKVRLIGQAPYIWLPQKPAGKERWLTEAEIGRLLSAPAAPHVRLAIVLMLATAARVTAILQLTWDRVDLDRGQIDLRLDAEGPRKGRAVLPINGMARAALVAAREAALTDHVIEYGGDPVKSIKRGFAAACKAAGLAGVSPHGLRHTAAVHMAAGGVPMSQVAQYLGHSNTSVTEKTYARYAPDHLRAAGEILDFGKPRRVK
jgi:integrase